MISEKSEHLIIYNIVSLNKTECMSENNLFEPDIKHLINNHIK